MSKIPDEIKNLINKLYSLLEKKYPDLEITIEIKIRPNGKPKVIDKEN